MRLRRMLGIAGAAAAGAYAAVQGANAFIRRQEHLDPNAIERPGGMFYMRGLGLHFFDRGSGPVLLLVHGFGAWTFSFRHQIDSLSRHFRVLAVDLPGFGLSDRPSDEDLSYTAHAERLREFLDRMGVERAAVLGHSIGGAIAMRLAAAHPERVDRLIVVAGAPPDRQFSVLRYHLMRPMLPIPLAVLAGGDWWIRRMLKRIVYDPAFVTPEVVEGYSRPRRLRGSTSSLLKLFGDIGRDRPLPPSAVPTRTLLLWGEADPVVPLREAHRMHAQMPDARLEVVPRAGHMVLEEQPEACDDAILRFLAVPNPARRAVAP